LGRLGQHCAVLLKELGIPVFGLNDVEIGSWDLAGMSQALDRLTIGDCTGCELAMARAQMSKLPTTFPMGLFGQQAVRLVRKLRMAGVEAEVRPQDALDPR